MATGNYGIVRPADFEPKDAEIFYTYTPDRTTVDNTIKKLNPTQVLKKTQNPDAVGELLGGLYVLQLPTTVFNAVGIYNIYIRPKAIRLRIQDCGVLASDTSRRGIVLNIQSIQDSQDRVYFENGGLIGFRIEFTATDSSSSEKKLQNYSLIVTSNFRVEPVSDNLSNSSQKGIRYIANDSSTLVFCTVTPSSAPSQKPNLFPFIGVPNQEIIISNTFFNPKHIEIEMVEHDAKTLSYALYGDQTKQISTGTRTIYTDDGNIFEQFSEYSIKDSTSQEHLYDVKKRKEGTEIDFSQDIDNV